MDDPVAVVYLAQEAPTSEFIVGNYGLEIRFGVPIMRTEVDLAADAIRIARIRVVAGLNDDVVITTVVLNEFLIIREAETYEAYLLRALSIFPLPGSVEIVRATVSINVIEQVVAAQNGYWALSATMSAQFRRFFLRSWFRLQGGDVGLVYANSLSGTAAIYGQAPESVRLPEAIMKLIADAEDDIPNDVLERANLATEYAGVNMALVRAAVAAVLLRQEDSMNNYFAATLVVSASLVSNKPVRFIKKCRESKLMTEVLTQVSVMIRDGNKDLGVTLSRVGRALPKLRYRAAMNDFLSGNMTHLQKIPGIPDWAKVFAYSGSTGVVPESAFNKHENLFAAISMCLGLLYAGNLKDAGVPAVTAQPWTVHWQEVREYNRLINGETIGYAEVPEAAVVMSESTALNIVADFARAKGRVHYLFNNPYKSDALEKYLANSESMDTLRIAFETKLRKTMAKMK